MSLLIVSLLALVVGPVLYRAAGAGRYTLAVLDGFVVMGITGLVLAHTLPHSIETAGFWALGATLLGLLGPGMVERLLHSAARTAHTITMILVVVGLTFHAFFDGVALGSAGQHGGEMLSIAVVLHRLPEAITLWWLLQSGRGARAAVAALAAIGIATVAGYVAGDLVADALEARWVALFQALVAGSVLHVVFHTPHHGVKAPRGGLPSGVGALIALAGVVFLSESHPLHVEPGGNLAVGATFLTLALESAPALLLAFAMAGLIQVFLPSATMSWMRTGRALSESARGMAFGLPLPICSCGVIPLYQTLVTQNVPATAAMAFLVATPELGLDAVLISWPLLGGELTLARIAAAAVIALLAGVVVGRIARAGHRHDPTANARVATPPRGSLWARARAGLAFGFGEIVDHTGPWLLLGLGAASLVEPMLDTGQLTALPAGLDVPLFALLGMPSYVCASGATPFAAVLIHKGVSPGAALAFLLTGPATNVTTFGILARLHGRKVAIAFGALVAGTSIALGYVVNAVLAGEGGIELHEAAAESAGWLETGSLIALAGVFLLSLLRQGPRGVIGQVLSPIDDPDDDCCGHDHGHDHDHDHGHHH